MNQKRQRRIYFLMSLFFHLAIICFILFLINIKHENIKNNIGTEEKVYLVTENALITKVNKVTKQMTLRTVVQKRDRSMHTNFSQPIKNIDSAIKPHDDSEYKGNPKELLIYLHNIIQKQLLLYQDEFTSFGESIFIVEFDLAPNGQLFNVTINADMPEKLKTELISIIQSISPLSAMPILLKEEQHFSLRVKLVS